ncbi:MAG TPA: helix-turn-helix domain-containing protein [Solirubrobacterales bacterium]
MPPNASELISAVNHPMRRRILSAYLDGSMESASASQLAETLDQRVGQVAYHLKTLAKGEILRPVRSGDLRRAGPEDHGWALAVEAEWLRLVLEVWADLDVSR